MAEALPQYPQTPLRAIRAKCIDCSGGSAHEVRHCPARGCPLWPMRWGRNPYHASAKARDTDPG